MRTWLLIFFLFSVVIAEEPLIVQVSSESSLLPLYLASIEQTDSSFPSSYLEHLEKVLRFDLQNNGWTYVVSKNAFTTDQLKKENQWNRFDATGWKSQRVSYVIKAFIKDKQLSLAAFSVDTNAIKGVENVPLSGALSEDRQAIHKIADTIQESFFGIKGIATSRILYTVRIRSTENPLHWQTDIWSADYDGANAKQISKEGFLCVNPLFIPAKDKSKPHHFMYVSYKIGQPKLFKASLKGGESERVTLLRGNQLMPALSPKKDCLAFVSDITGNPEIFIQKFSLENGLLGKPRLIFSAPNGAQASPTFNADGTKLAFVSNKDGYPRIYTIPVMQSSEPLKPTMISKTNRDNTCPAWSPDGTKIAYSSQTKGVRQIWIYDCQTGKESQLTNGSGHKENPAWASDSLHLLFNSSSDTSADLYLINLRQKEAVLITKGSGEKRFPAWEP